MYVVVLEYDGVECFVFDNKKEARDFTLDYIKINQLNNAKAKLYKVNNESCEVIT